MGTVVSDTFLDRLQEVSSAGAWNCVLKISGTTIQVIASTGQDAAAVVVQGHMRYVESTLTITFAGGDASGAYGIWAVTTSDDNDPAWLLVKVAGTASPSGYPYVRKLGTVSWSGTDLSALNQIAGFEKHAHLHQVGAGDELPANAVGTSQLVSSSVTTAKILDANVTTAKILDANVTSAKILDANVTTAKSADANVTTAKIADASVTTAKVLTANITSAKIADGAITSTHLSSGAVTTAAIANGTVALGDLAAALQEALVPTGSIIAFGGSSAPTGWLICDGTATYSTTGTYADLFAVFAYTYGGSAGLFGVPDLRARVPFGFASTVSGVNTLASNDAVTVNSRLGPTHTHAHSLTLPTHAHSHSLTLPTHVHSHTIAVTGGNHGHGFNLTAADHQHQVSNASNVGVAGGGIFPPFLNNGWTIGTSNALTVSGTIGSDGGVASTVSGGVGNNTTSPTIAGAVGNNSSAPAISGAVTSTTTNYVTVNYIVKY